MEGPQGMSRSPSGCVSSSGDSWAGDVAQRDLLVAHGDNSLPGPVILQKLKVHIRLRPHLCHANISSALQLFVLLSTEQEWPLLEDLISGFTQKVTAENTPALDSGASDGMAERFSISVKQTIKYENGILKWYY